MLAAFEYTTFKRLDAWMKNIRKNMPILLDVDQNNILNIQNTNKAPTIIINGGPSVELFGHLDMLAKAKLDEYTIIAVDRMLKPSLERHIIPDFVVSCDLNVDMPGYATFFDYDLVRQHSKSITGLFASVCNPQVVKSWDGPKYLFHPDIDIPQMNIELEMVSTDTTCPHCHESYTFKMHTPSISMALARLTGHTIIKTLGNVGGLSVVLATQLGQPPICLLGYDFSYTEEDADDTDAYLWLLKRGMTREQALLEFRHISNKDLNSEYLTDTSMHAYSIALENMIRCTSLKVINCTERGILFGDGITQMTFKEFLSNW